jgi:hypothetical protein
VLQLFRIGVRMGGPGHLVVISQAMEQGATSRVTSASCT